MKIHFLSHPTAFSLPGGGEVQMLETIKELQKIGHECILLDINDTSQWSSIQYLHLFSVCNGIEVYARWAIDNHIPYVVSPILWAEEYPLEEFNRVRFILLNSAAILPNSTFEKERIIKYLHLEDIDNYFIVKNGCDTSVFHQIKRDEDDVVKRSILTVANIDKRKNLINLAEAVRNTRSQLTIAGSVRDDKILSELINNFSDCVSHIGPIINGSDMHINLLKKANIFALPSLYETPGIAALEAGAAGVPLLVTSIGATYEYFNSFASYVDPLSAKDIENKLNEIYTSNKFSLSVDARNSLAGYTWMRAAIETENAYVQAFINKKVK